MMSTSKKLKIACVQLRARDVEERRESLKEALDGIREASGFGAQIVVLPEAVFPGYVLDRWAEDPDSPDESRSALESFRESAMENGVYLAVGLALHKNGRWINGAVLIDTDGDIILEEGKRFLWHFDDRWFEKCHSYDLADTPWGKIGLLICADARNPEVLSNLSRKGADLILDLANLTSSGKDADLLSNQQVNFMLPVRAFENCVWIAMANKSGMENRSVVYCGKSGIYDPSGRSVAALGSKDPGVLVEEIDLSNRPSMVPLKEGICGTLIEEKFPVFQGEAAVVMVSLAQLDWDSLVVLNRVKSFVRQAWLQRADLLVLSPLPDSDEMESLAMELLLDLSRSYENMWIVFARESGPKGPISWSIKNGQVCNVSLGTHGSGVGDTVPVVRTDIGNWGISIGEDGYVPEISRIQAIEGAEMLVWFAPDGPMTEPLARSRAAENKLFVVAAASASVGGSLIVSPDGAVLSQAFVGEDQMISALCPLCLSREKSVVPGTDVLSDRSPEDNIFRNR